MHLQPRTAEEVADIVRDALESRRTLEIRGHGTRTGFGRAVEADAIVELRALSGVRLYEPAELVLTAYAGTPLQEIQALLAAHGQHLAFEPPNLAALWNSSKADAGTIGGCLAVGLGGSRRFVAGAPRDHFLGFRAVNGFGEPFAAGGRVVKNVTGYDLPKLMAGSFGTLGILTEVTLKVLPAPPSSQSILLFGLEDAEAISALSAAMASSSAQVSGAAHLPTAVASRSSIPQVSAARAAVTALRLEGVAPSVATRASELQTLMTRFAREIGRLDVADSTALWHEISDVKLLAPGASSLRSTTAAMPVWRLSVPPSRAAAVMRRIRADAAVSYFYDWAGGEIWLAIHDERDDGGATMIRESVSVEAESGHATLVRASRELRSRVPVFHPASDAVAALTRRVKERFDPSGLLNPGRMYQS